MSVLHLPLELFLDIVSCLSTNAVFHLLLTCKAAHYHLRKYLYREICLDQEHARQARGFMVAAAAGKLCVQDLQNVRRLVLGDTFARTNPHQNGEFQCQLVDSIIPTMTGLESLKVEIRGDTAKQHQWIFSEKLADLDGVNFEVALNESFVLSSFSQIPMILRRPSNVVAVTLDIRALDTHNPSSPTTFAELYRALSTLSNLRRLEIANLPEYLREPSLFIINFSFISSGQTFALSSLTSTLACLTHLNFYPSGPYDLTSHPPLSTNLKSLVLNMPRLSPDMVSAMFSLQNLHTLRLVEPASLSETWTLSPSHQPAFTKLKEFGFGAGDTWPLKNRYYYFTKSLPHGFIEAIITRNHSLKQLGVVHLTDSIISLLPSLRHLVELEAAFTFDFSEQTYTLSSLTAAVEAGSFNCLQRWYLPFSGLKLDIPFLKAVAGCPALVDLQIVDTKDGGEDSIPEPPRPKGVLLGQGRDNREGPRGLAGKVLFDAELQELGRWQNRHHMWGSEFIRGVCADGETYAVAQPFLTIGRCSGFGSPTIQCVLDQASLNRRLTVGTARDNGGDQQ